MTAVTMELHWKGDPLKAHMANAARKAVDETNAKCVSRAKALTPVRTGALQGSEKFVPAQIRGDEVVGVWGSFNINYAIYVELGTSRRPGRFMFRQAADLEYPGLPERIKKHFQSGLL